MGSVIPNRGSVRELAKTPSNLPPHACMPQSSARDGSMADARLRGGVDLGGTKIQTVVVDGDHAVLGEARCPTPTSGGPNGVAAAIAGALREAASPLERQDERPRAHRRRLAGRDRRRAPARSRARATCPAGRTPTRSARCSRSSSAPRSRSATTSRSRPTPSSGSARPAPYRSALGVFWGTGVGGGIVLDGEPWIGQGSAGEIGHVCVQMRDGLRCPCGRRGCMEAYAGRGALERARASCTTRATTPSSSRSPASAAPSG